MWKWKPLTSLLQRRLVERHHVGERHPPEIVEPDDHVAEHRREIAPLVVIAARPMVATLRSGATYVS